jgi:hypothetical protein
MPNDQDKRQAAINRRKAEASLACEGLYLTPEQEALFDQFEAEGLSHEERRRRILERHAQSVTVQSS